MKDVFDPRESQIHDRRVKNDHEKGRICRPYGLRAGRIFQFT
jgi:hypothetical protein